jgi:hypothetical protein
MKIKAYFMPPRFERANIRFFYLFKNNITGLFSVK